MMVECFAKEDVMRALQSERELLTSFNMWGAESVLIRYGINVINELPTILVDEGHLRQAATPHT